MMYLFVFTMELEYKQIPILNLKTNETMVMLILALLHLVPAKINNLSQQGTVL